MGKNIGWGGRALILSSAGMGMAAAAQAQTITAAPIDMFGRARNVSVLERPHQEYEAIGIRAGSFMVFPKAELRVETNDNLFATSAQEQSDQLGILRADLLAQSGWSRHSLTAYATLEAGRYADFDSEDYETYSAGIDGRADILRTAFATAGLFMGHSVEPRTNANTPSASARPIEFDVSKVNAAASRTFNRLRLKVQSEWQVLDYKDGATALGANIDQDGRDRDVVTYSGRADYAVSPDTAFFVQAIGNAHDYRRASTALVPARDSNGYQLLAGADFDISNLVRGEIAVGVVGQNFDDPAFEDTENVGGRALVEYFPTQLTTVTFTASRSVEDSAITSSGGFVSSAVGVQIDHELRRNVILTARAGLSRDNFDGIDRTDDHVTAGLGATYLINRNLGISGLYSVADQSSDGLNNGTDYRVNRLAISLVGQF